MFDISARPLVEKDVLTFAAPMKKFQTMVANMDESFLITHYPHTTRFMMIP